MVKRAILSLLTVLVISAFQSAAFEAGAVRSMIEKNANWLIGQYDFRTKTFGTATAPEQLAMVVKVLCDNPRDYKEANGPFISEPVKVMLSKVDESGHVSGMLTSEAEAALWIVTGLKATKNEKYAPVMEKLRARIKELGRPEFPKFDPAHLQPTVVTAESMRNAIAGVLQAGEEGKKEIEVDGKPVKWAEVLGESLAKLQQPDGSFGPDIQANAMALYILNLYFKTL